VLGRRLDLILGIELGHTASMAHQTKKNWFVTSDGTGSTTRINTWLETGSCPYVKTRYSTESSTNSVPNMDAGRKAKSDENATEDFVVLLEDCNLIESTIV
jgi:hypothetical protein